MPVQTDSSSLAMSSPSRSSAAPSSADIIPSVGSGTPGGGTSESCKASAMSAPGSVALKASFVLPSE
eukprot:CAMPEP_0206497364 /NCGR_PEP_ID=MMETSP0324_2-20121206/50145_1 /ASSEMBLY_ACC=CAM_ASM_000836 /TAXON_ID=2866 /ORGANISM="Crypthecodinium cohnii, Strain Seligo" /LENGTH=66 /DNA_ID=CAMNT_0053982927 /DNA_START=301 /DNA_END=501 /DNA_ORIENTATION=+